MSSQKYRRLLTNLPSMAAVVNSFQSPEVQREVYKLLVAELEDAVDDAIDEKNGVTRSNGVASSNRLNGDSHAELAHAIVDGESIHADDGLED